MHKASPKQLLHLTWPANYLVKVIFVIRETFKQKATCNRKKNHQMQRTGCWQEPGTA